VALNKNLFAQGQAYVALSRAVTEEFLFISQLDFSAIKADPEALAEYQRLEEKAALSDWGNLGNVQHDAR
jgi:ATP-dependent exoDNAse (exonuclease V) alpha subunit